MSDGVPAREHASPVSAAAVVSCVVDDLELAVRAPARRSSRASSRCSRRATEFEFRPGPVFANVLLVDEINRARFPTPLHTHGATEVAP
jgi:MoxR-like ATPase